MTKKTIGTTHHERPRLLSLAKQAEKDQPQNPKTVGRFGKLTEPTSQNEKHIQTSTTLTKSIRRIEPPPPQPCVWAKSVALSTMFDMRSKVLKDFPNAFAAFDNEITLPLNTKMTMEDLEYVIESLVEILKG